MTKNLLQSMKELTPCPNPCRKDMFLRMYRKRTGSKKTEICEMIKSQFTYISAPIWITTFAALFIALWGAFTKHNVITGIAALMPFVSGFAVFESFRSRMYGMSELEGATLFSLRGVFFARTVCIGSVLYNRDHDHDPIPHLIRHKHESRKKHLRKKKSPGMSGDLCNDLRTRIGSEHGKNFLSRLSYGNPIRPVHNSDPAAFDRN